MTARRFGSASTVRHPFARSTWLAGLQLRFNSIFPADGDLTSMLQICQSCPEVPQRLRLRRASFRFSMMQAPVRRAAQAAQPPLLSGPTPTHAVWIRERSIYFLGGSYWYRSNYQSGNSGTYSNDLRYDNGRLYLTSGGVLNATSGNLLGTFAACRDRWRQTQSLGAHLW